MPSRQLAPQRGSPLQFMLMTIPLLIVLVYFLNEAWKRPSLAIYNLPDNYSDYQYQTAVEESGTLLGLMNILAVFLILHVISTSLTVYVVSFIAKRRHLIGRYLAEGEVTMGDVIYDKRSRFFGGFHDYGYTLYAHPTQQKLIRKRVRVYQAWTRERVPIVRLPNRPLSGQSKIDLEIDLNAAKKDRDNGSQQITAWLLFWVVFTLCSSLFVIYQMSKIEDPSDDVSKGIKIFLIVVGLNVPFAFAVNWIRFLAYRNWMFNRGAIIDDDGDARKIQGCIKSAQSEDGSDVIPYSILEEEEMSYQGSVPSHSNSVQGADQKPNFAPPLNLGQHNQGAPLGGDPNGPTWVTMA